MRLLLLLLVACGEAAPPVVLEPEPDAAPSSIDASPAPVTPTLLSTMPADGALDVEPTTTVRADFSAAPAGASLIVTRDGQPVAGSTRVEGSAVIFVPDQRLTLRGHYQAVLTTDATVTTFAFDVRDGDWTAAEPFVDLTRGNGFLLALRGRPGEGAVALSTFTEAGGTKPSQLRLSRLGTVASLPEVVDGDTGDLDSADVVPGASGRAIVVWARKRGPAPYEVLASRDDGTATWSVADPLPAQDDSWFGLHAVSDGADGVSCVWIHPDDGIGSVWGGRWTPGEGWATPAPVESLASEVDDLALTGGPDGQAIVSWTHLESPSQQDVRASRYTPGVGWGDSPALDPPAADNATHPATSGGFVVWSQSSEVWASQALPTGDWSEPLALADHHDASLPAVASNARGDALVVWSRRGTKTYTDIWVARFVAGEGWKPAEIIDSEELGNALVPQAALDADGNGAVAWRQKNAAGWNVWVNRWRSGAGWTGARLLDGPQVDDPRVVVDGTGQIFVAWRREGPTALLVSVLR